MKSLLLPSLAAWFLIAAAPAAEPIESTLTGRNGPITGDGPDGSVVVLGFEHEIISPRDPATGQATGRRQHKPVRIVKSIDKSSPLLYRAIATNEILPTVEFRFRRSTEKGAEIYYKVTLTNASIAAIRQWKPNTRDLSADRAGDLEEVSFTYQTITWRFEEGGVEESDTWETNPG
jgi:type VI secretion system secreted protein Hcp